MVADNVGREGASESGLCDGTHYPDEIGVRELFFDIAVSREWLHAVGTATASRNHTNVLRFRGKTHKSILLTKTSAAGRCIRYPIRFPSDIQRIHVSSRAVAIINYIYYLRK